MVHEHAGELAADGLRQQGGAHGGVHAAAEGQQDLAVSHLLPDLGDGGVLVVFHGPVAFGAADLIQEVADHGDAIFRVVHFRMELHAVKAPLFVGNGHIGAVVGVGDERESIRHPGHVIPVAHPGDALGGQILEEFGGVVVIGLCLAVLPGGVVLGGRDLTAQRVGHELAAVADAQNGHAPGEDFRVHMGGGLQIHGVGAAGEDDADGVQGLQLGERGGIGLDLAVHAALTHPAGNELVILAAEIQNQDKLVVVHC